MVPPAFGRSRALLAPSSETSGLQDGYERVRLCCLFYQVCAGLLRPPQETNAGSYSSRLAFQRSRRRFQEMTLCRLMS